MRLITTLGLATIASANITFNHIPLQCSPSKPQIYGGCLRGQVCLENGTCEAANDRLTSRSEPIEIQTRAVYSTDGTCGGANSGKICNPNSTIYKGTCCSQYGWCGSGPSYCGTGCQSGCTGSETLSTPSTTPSSTAPRMDGQCGKAFEGATCDPTGPYGGCCSQYGYCGSTDGHCLVSNGCQSGCEASASSSNTISTLRSAPSAANPRTDGQCGSSFSGAPCDPAGPFGGCCSQYGWCGTTPGHCLMSNGCQSGCTNGVSTSRAAAPITTTGEPVVKPVSSTAAPITTNNAKATTDGTCGSSNGDTICGSWPNGNCCSMYGFCGNTSAHCGAGCQSGNCISAPAVAPPSASPAPIAPNGGAFSIVGQSGVPAMHAALLPNGHVFFLDKIENYTQLMLPNQQYAYSAEYNPVDNTVIPLSYKTNAFCSGGTFLPDGRVISVGGNAPLTWLDPTVGDGFDAIRYLDRSSLDNSLNGQSWIEPGNKLASARWYATAQTMPDGRVFVASGSLNGLDPAVPSNNNPTYEILSAAAVSEGNNIPLQILEKNQPYYMYPFVHLLKDGTLYIFVSKSSEQFSLASNASLQTYPDLPGDYRTYPNTGGSVLLPLSSSNNWNPDIIICGGGAYQDITSPTDPSCGRINPLSGTPSWEMDSMPEGRGMVEGTLLPDGNVLWLNGGSKGAQGFGLCTDPALEALLYSPTKPLGQRWSSLASSTIPRLYHSVALLLLDGTVMVAGSNPVQMPVLQPDANNPYVTEFRVENYVPPYLQGVNANKRPTNVLLSTKTIVPNGSTFTIQFTAPTGGQGISVALYHGGFVTHSVHMGHRMLQLDTLGWKAGAASQTITVTAPPNNNVAPPGPYVVYVLCDGVPAIGQFVTIT